MVSNTGNVEAGLYKVELFGQKSANLTISHSIQSCVCASRILAQFEKREINLLIQTSYQNEVCHRMLGLYNTNEPKK